MSTKDFIMEYKQGMIVKQADNLQSINSWQSYF